MNGNNKCEGEHSSFVCCERKNELAPQQCRKVQSIQKLFNSQNEKKVFLLWKQFHFRLKIIPLY